MEKSRTYFLSVCSSILLYSGCTQESWYKREFTETEQKKLAQSLLINSTGGLRYYQGSVADQLLLAEALRYDSTNAAVWREIGTPYLKRGMAYEFQQYYGKAADLDPVEWRGWMGYMYLYFYRDFHRAIASFDATDTLTPNFTDYPQGQSVDYMRGIAYYGLGEYERAYDFLTRYINEVTQSEGEEWVDTYAFLYRGLTQEKLGQLSDALADFSTVRKYDKNLSDSYFHLSRVHLRQGNLDAAERLLAQAQQRFDQGYFHQRPYIEVLEQIYTEDLVQLSQRIQDQSTY